MLVFNVLHDVYLFSDVLEFCRIFIHLELLINFYCVQGLRLLDYALTPFLRHVRRLRLGEWHEKRVGETALLFFTGQVDQPIRAFSQLLDDLVSGQVVAFLFVCASPHGRCGGPEVESGVHHDLDHSLRIAGG